MCEEVFMQQHKDEEKSSYEDHEERCRRMETKDEKQKWNDNEDYKKMRRKDK